MIRLAFMRIFLPLAILCFLSSRLLHPGEWLTNQGFHIQNLGHKDWRQPLYIPTVSLFTAVVICIMTTLSGLLLSIGLKSRAAAGIFTISLVYLALADRLETFTVGKIGAVLALALFMTPSGSTVSLDAWIKNRHLGVNENKKEKRITWGNIRFFQALILILYFASGLSKMRGDWLHHDHVLWTHIHDSYQTLPAFWVAQHFPKRGWHLLQYIVLVFEVGAPIWFLCPYTRRAALWSGLAMHTFIGLCFGPVVWFALLMMLLLIGCFGSEIFLIHLLRQGKFVNTNRQ